MSIPKLKKYLGIDQLETLIFIKETKMGIQTYVNKDINKLNNAYKRQIKTFLEDVIKDWGKK